MIAVVVLYLIEPAQSCGTIFAAVAPVFVLSGFGLGLAYGQVLPGVVLLVYFDGALWIGLASRWAG